MAFSTVPLHGKDAQITDGGVAIGYSTGWSINVTLDMGDASRQGQDWKEFLPGQASWSGSMDFHMILGNTYQKVLIDNIIAATPGTKITDIRFSLDTTLNAFYGNIYITSFNTAPSVNGGVVSCSFNFQGDSTLAVEATS